MYHIKGQKVKIGQKRVFWACFAHLSTIQNTIPVTGTFEHTIQPKNNFIQQGQVKKIGDDYWEKKSFPAAIHVTIHVRMCSNIDVNIKVIMHVYKL